MKSKNNMTSEKVEKTLEGLLKNMLTFEKEKTENMYRDFIERLINKNKGFIDDIEDFNIFVNYQIEKVLEVSLEKMLTKELEKVENKSKIFNVLFLYKNYSFMENNVKEVIVLKEGRACSADKSRWVLESYKKYLIDGIIPDMTITEKCYWKPRFGTGKEWMDFCDSLISLYYGRPQDGYLITLQNLTKCCLK